MVNRLIFDTRRRNVTQEEELAGQSTGVGSLINVYADGCEEIAVHLLREFALLLRVSWAIDTTNCITYRQSCSAKQRKTSKRIHT
ncbi:hypothetical protein DTO164E3_726 [Paecilomyces variotii]|nr:hypothetical protein DTO164E3_726 [Paecilomyces variotii]KAJ9362890.1 hypothetical protein DTO280E4_3239 [Paecilomyces variotii]KAJ9406279.1 hypothetical protein DTO045G8_5915 [Paecilomyces variotii]